MTESPKPISDDIERAAHYLAQGDAFAEKERWTEAQAAFSMAAKLAPKASLAWLSYALACWPQQLYGPAGQAIEDCLHFSVPILDTPAFELRGIFNGSTVLARRASVSEIVLTGQRLLLMDSEGRELYRTDGTAWSDEQIEKFGRAVGVPVRRA